MQRIVDGYRKRDRLTHQMLAEVVYAAMYANPYRKNDGKSVADLFPMLFKNEDGVKDEITGGIDQETYNRLQAEMRRINEGHAE